MQLPPAQSSSRVRKALLSQNFSWGHLLWWNLFKSFPLEHLGDTTTTEACPGCLDTLRPYVSLRNWKLPLCKYASWKHKLWSSCWLGVCLTLSQGSQMTPAPPVHTDREQLWQQQHLHTWEGQAAIRCPTEIVITLQIPQPGSKGGYLPVTEIYLGVLTWLSV